MAITPPNNISAQIGKPWEGINEKIINIKRDKLSE
tara:strand:+ start:498 stop:602 length:105 start_codon:yes stop_codon:yes gene_type:complete